MKQSKYTRTKNSLVRVLSCAALWMYATAPSHVVMASSMTSRGSKSVLLSLRGGRSFEPYGNSSPQYEQQQQQYVPDNASSPPPPPATTPFQYTDVPQGEEELFDSHVSGESFQDRIDTWREYQQEHSGEQQESIRDDQGRLKLLTSVSKGSRVIVFFLLMWRDVYLYEAVDLYFKGPRRLMLVTPLTFMFCANLFGVVASLSSSLSHGGKKRLKAILNLDKLFEMCLVVWSLLRLIVTSPSSALIPRETYIAQILHSVFFILQCQAVTRLVWDDKVAVPQHAAYQETQARHPPPPEYSPNNY